MSDWIRRGVEEYGYEGVCLLTFLESVFPPIPSEIIMPLAGFLTARGDMTLAGVTLAGTLGALAGSLVFYYLGRRIGAERLAAWADRRGRWLGLSGRDVRRAQAWFDRHGGKAVFLGRLVPGVRSLISIPAGMAKMDLAQFLLYTAAGSGVWSGLLAYGGSRLGAHYHELGQWVSAAAAAVVSLLAALVLGFIVWRRLRACRSGGDSG